MQEKSVLVYSPQITNRLRYACLVIGQYVLNTPFHLTNQPDEVRNWGGPVINYSDNKLSPEHIWIQPASLLFETGISNNLPQVSLIQNQPVLFATSHKEEFAFDLFSAVFYMVSRYEEYLPFEPDQFGRFPEKASLAGKNGFTQLPVVNIWCQLLVKAIQERYPAYMVPAKKTSVLFTYDIDVAYAFKGRSLSLHVLSFIKDLLKGRLYNIKAKLQTGFGQHNDPSDTYDLIFSNPIRKHFFFLLAEKKGGHDNNLSPRSTALQKLIRETSQQFVTGIHPSYHSGKTPGLIQKEKQTLENISHKPVTTSRQHFLRFFVPQTHRLLIEAGIQEDYSMAWPEQPGFRAGICCPYPFFDVEKNEITSLILHPGCIMETTFRDDLHIPASDCLPYYQQLFNEVDKYGGAFIAIWHNDSFIERATPDHPLNFRQLYIDFTNWLASNRRV